MLHSSIILSGESYTFEDQDKSIVRCLITQRTCLFSLEKWPHLEIFQHKTILVACKKFQLLIYNTKRYKVITIQVFTKTKKKPWNTGNTSFSEKTNLQRIFCAMYIFQ